MLDSRAAIHADDAWRLGHDGSRMVDCAIEYSPIMRLQAHQLRRFAECGTPLNSSAKSRWQQKALVLKILVLQILDLKILVLQMLVLKILVLKI